MMTEKIEKFTEKMSNKIEEKNSSVFQFLSSSSRMSFLQWSYSCNLRYPSFSLGSTISPVYKCFPFPKVTLEVKNKVCFSHRVSLQYFSHRWDVPPFTPPSSLAPV